MWEKDRNGPYKGNMRSKSRILNKKKSSATSVIKWVTLRKTIRIKSWVMKGKVLGLKLG